MKLKRILIISRGNQNYDKLISDFHRQEPISNTGIKSWSNIVQQPPHVNIPILNSNQTSNNPPEHGNDNSIYVSKITNAQYSNSNMKSKPEEQVIAKKVKKKDPIQFDILQAIQVISWKKGFGAFLSDYSDTDISLLAIIHFSGN